MTTSPVIAPGRVVLKKLPIHVSKKVCFGSTGNPIARSKSHQRNVANGTTIKTSTATVGIRGGIAIVEASPEETKASFVYGVEMEVAPIENPDNSKAPNSFGIIISS